MNRHSSIKELKNMNKLTTLILPVLLLTLVPAALVESRALAADPSVPPATVEVSVDCAQTVNIMRGGIGASMHAMETTIPYGVKNSVFSGYSHGGSCWGGYPPAEDEQAWQQIYRHASWLGLDWNKVEIEQRVYEPERDQFSFDNPEMRILYRILDWNQKNGADVFFAQVWCNAAWLAYPELRDDPVGRVHSAPNDLEAFANGLATLMEYLIKKRGYTCIKWLCMNNEPGESFSWWQAPPNKPLDIGAGVAAVRKALDAHGLNNLPLSGPDTVKAFPPAVPGGYDFLPLLGAYDFHYYGWDFDFRPHGIAMQERNAAVWAKHAHNENKPLFVSEFGTPFYGWVPDEPGPSTPPAVLACSELIIRLANAGVDGFNRWSFLNRGDLDGQWQFVDTWDRKQKKLLTEFPPHPNSYFCVGLISRFTAKNSAVLSSQVSPTLLDGKQRVFCAAFRSPKGNLTIAIVNDAPVEFPLKLALSGTLPSLPFYRYRYTEAERDRADVTIDPQPVTGTNAWQDTLPPNSLTIFSTYQLDHKMPGVTMEAESR